MSLETLPELAVSPNVNVTASNAQGPAPLLMASVSTVVPDIVMTPDGPARALSSEVPPMTVETIRCRCLPCLKLFCVLVHCT